MEDNGQNIRARSGIEYLNDALETAGITGITMTKTPAGQLFMDTGELEFDEVVNKLLSGIAALYGQLLSAQGS
jgi:hypothetical protein